MPSWWPEPGYRWLLNPAKCEFVVETLMLAHPNHPPIIWNLNPDGEWDYMRKLHMGRHRLGPVVVGQAPYL